MKSDRPKKRRQQTPGTEVRIAKSSRQFLYARSLLSLPSYLEEGLEPADLYPSWTAID